MLAQQMTRLIAIGTCIALAGCDLALGLDDFRDPAPGAMGGSAAAGGAGANGGTAASGGNGSGGDGGVGGAGGDVPEPVVTWARSLGDGARQHAIAMAVSPNGEIVIGGAASGQISYAWSANDTCPSVGPFMPDDDPFLIALRDDGCVTRDAAFSATSSAPITSIATTTNHVLIAGNFLQDLTIDELMSATAQDTYWARLNPNFTVVSSDSRTASGNQSGSLVAGFGSQGIWSTRTAANDVFIEPVLTLTFNPFTLATSGGINEVHAMTLDADELIVAGEIEGSTVTFPSSCSSQTTEGTDAFVAALDASNGDCKWITLFSGFGEQRAMAIAADDAGVYVAGKFTGTIEFPDNMGLAAAQDEDAFVAMLDRSGELLWQRTSNASDNERAESIAITESGNIAVGGSFYAGLGLGSASTQNAFDEDGFVVLLEPTSGSLIWEVIHHGEGQQTIDAVAAAGGQIYAMGHHKRDATIGSWMLRHSQNSTGGGELDIVVASIREAL